MLLAMEVAAQRLPWCFLSLPARVWTDRMERRMPMLRADLIRLALILMVLALVLSTSRIPLPDD